ncbi:MAG: fibronectin type III domain-containing protein [Oscillospiraceae bacterium]|nr:fibronectin type III domain-containing protein [Oscillospiraceae bacterium]
MRKINIRSCLSLVLVLCMLLSMSTTVLAAETCAVAQAVEDAVFYCGKSDELVVIIKDLVTSNDYYEVMTNADARQLIKNMAINKIIEILGETKNEALMEDFGFEPTDANKKLVAEEVFAVACMYADELLKNGGKDQPKAYEPARKVAIVELIRFVLDKTKKDKNAKEKAEAYYAINAASDKVKVAEEKGFAHSFVAGKVTAPTCTEKGYTTYTCSCGLTKTGDEVVEKGHSYGKVVTAPTCTEKGYTTYTCSACSHSYTGDEVAVTDHSWDNGVVTKEPTETTEGVKTYTCGSCGTTKTEKIPTVHTCVFNDATCTLPKTCPKCGTTEGSALGHSYTTYVSNNDATCTKDGTKTAACDRGCGTKDTVADADTKLNHKYTDYISNKDATCTKDGTKTAVCDYGCGTKDTVADTGSAKGHSWTDATCTTPKTCSVCGATEGKAKDHTYKDTVTAPTCTEKGYTTHTCTVCGSSYKDTEVAALDHAWDEGVVTREPTENRTGTKRYTCTVCKTTKNETLPKLEHTHNYTEKVVEPTCSEAGYTSYTCSCGDSYKENEVAALGHKYSSVVTSATCTEAGYITYTCATCNHSYNESRGNALGHNEITDKGYAATCTEDGLTDGTHCDRCNTVLTEQKVIPATGHKYQNGVCSGCGQAEPVTKLDAPQILSCYSKQQTSVKVTWSLVEDADGYELYRSTNPNRNYGYYGWTLIKTITDGKTDRYTNQGLEEGTTYYYRVRAYVVNEDGSKVYSDYSATSYMPAAVIWDAPYSNATTRIRLRWEETTGAHGYQIWKLNEDATWSIVKTLGDKGNTLTNNQGATTAYSNTGLTAGESCTYKMRAFMITEDGRKVFGAYSDEVTVAVMPEAPVAVGASVKAGSAKLSWEEVNGAAGYQIWMLNDGQWSIIKSATDGSTVYTKYDLQSGAEYQFKIRAYTELNGKKTFGDFSEVVTVTVK